MKKNELRAALQKIAGLHVFERGGKLYAKLNEPAFGRGQTRKSTPQALATFWAMDRVAKQFGMKGQSKADGRHVWTFAADNGNR